MAKKKYSLLFGMASLLWVGKVMALELHSPAFHQGEKIPAQYTCDGGNVSPPLFWKEVPVGTKTLALVMDDPDAPNGTWVHWVIYNIPPDITSLNENLQALPSGAQQGKNSWNNFSYGGPCPPDKSHRHFFKLYAVDTYLPNNEGMDKMEVEKAMRGHILASTELVANYQRSK